MKTPPNRRLGLRTGLEGSGCGRQIDLESMSLRLSHINITMPKGREEAARAFYAGLLGLREILKPEPLRDRGGVWFDAGGLDVHVSVEKNRKGPDHLRHFGLECANVEELRARLKTAGVVMDAGRPAPWQRFFVNDPFGNRIEIHEAGGLGG
jgi:catechol 2,3-dioxygenase-like lactoylglutathione lyase family enzyme